MVLTVILSTDGVVLSGAKQLIAVALVVSSVHSSTPTNTTISSCSMFSMFSPYKQQNKFHWKLIRSLLQIRHLNTIGNINQKTYTVTLILISFNCNFSDVKS